MKTIYLPKLIKEKKYGRKNILKQVLLEKSRIVPTEVTLNEGHLVIASKEGQICIAQSEAKFSESFSKVLLANKRPTVELLNANSLELNWLKYPDLKEEFNPDKVCESWDGCFSFKEENIEKSIFGLRKPQIAAIFNVLSHWKVGDEIATVVMPTGTGKTETMLSLLVANRCGKLLVTVPTDPLRDQIAEKFLSLGYLQRSEFGIISDAARKPIVGILYENFKEVA